MNIILEYQDTTGWHVERSISCRDDMGLVNEILERVDRVEEDVVARTEESYPQEAEEDQAPEEEKQENQGDTGVFSDSWRWSCRISRKSTGRTRARPPPLSFRLVCKECGEEIELSSTAPVLCHCETCGRDWTYVTNSTQSEVTVKCLQCKTRMVARWNKKLKKYIT